MSTKMQGPRFPVKEQDDLDLCFGNKTGKKKTCFVGKKGCFIFFSTAPAWPHLAQNRSSMQNRLDLFPSWWKARPPADCGEGAGGGLTSCEVCSQGPIIVANPMASIHLMQADSVRSICWEKCWIPVIPSGVSIQSKVSLGIAITFLVR